MGGGLQDPNAARRLANAAPELKRHLKAEFDRAAQRVADETRRRILAAETHHDGTLKAEIAATVSTRGRVTLAGVSAVIKSDGKKMPEGKQNLAAYANAGKSKWRRWRHPVYARSDQERSEWTWVAQEWPSARGWFDDTVRGEAQRFSDAVQAAIDETSAYLNGGI